MSLGAPFPLARKRCMCACVCVRVWGGDLGFRVQGFQLPLTYTAPHISLSLSLSLSVCLSLSPSSLSLSLAPLFRPPSIPWTLNLYPPSLPPSLSQVEAAQVLWDELGVRCRPTRETMGDMAAALLLLPPDKIVRA